MTHHVVWLICLEERRVNKMFSEVTMSHFSANLIKRNLTRHQFEAMSLTMPSCLEIQIDRFCIAKPPSP